MTDAATFVIGLALIGLVTLAADDSDRAVRYVARSWRGAVIYLAGCALLIVAIASRAAQ